MERESIMADVSYGRRCPVKLLAEAYGIINAANKKGWITHDFRGEENYNHFYDAPSWNSVPWIIMVRDLFEAMGLNPEDLDES